MIQAVFFQLSKLGLNLFQRGALKKYLIKSKINKIFLKKHLHLFAKANIIRTSTDDIMKSVNF
ncbi:hypothetical protein BWP33_08260 [Simonsiella muelleri ATCC 29453]|nr:hypothetical protein BWP33_08260 [Simonsiella muelleri ATCC 29453]